MKNEQHTAGGSLQQLAKQGQAEAILAREWRQEELDATDGEGRTALMAAAIQGDYKVAAALRAKGANLEIKDYTGRKAVELAALHRQGLVLLYLVDGGCGG